MAKGRRVISDVSSEEIDQLRICLHSLMLVLRDVATRGAAAADLAALQVVLTSLATSIDTGVDSSTGLKLEGVVPTPKHPARRSTGTLVTLNEKDL